MFYSVHKGKQPGIYSNWNECKQNIDGYSKPIFKKFNNSEEAEFFLKNGFSIVKQNVDIPRDFKIVWTDGSCKKKGDTIKSGYGIYFGDNDKRNMSERFKLNNPTNNRAELYAILECIKIIKNDEKYVIITDSQYSIDSVTKFSKKWEKNDWKTVDGSDVKNRELIEPIYDKIKNNKNIELRHLNSHTGCSDKFSEGNKMADKLANDGCDK